MEISNSLFSAIISRDIVWFRCRDMGEGFAIKRTPLLFSERLGKTKYFKLLFGWRLELLSKWTPKVKITSNAKDTIDDFGGLNKVWGDGTWDEK